MLAVPFQFSIGVNVNISPATDIVTFSSSLSALKTSSVSSTSLADKVIVSGVSSSVVSASNSYNTGASFTFSTVIKKAWVNDTIPSDTVNTTLWDPTSSFVGVPLIVAVSSSNVNQPGKTWAINVNSSSSSASSATIV